MCHDPSQTQNTEQVFPINNNNKKVKIKMRKLYFLLFCYTEYMTVENKINII